MNEYIRSVTTTWLLERSAAEGYVTLSEPVSRLCLVRNVEDYSLEADESGSQ